MRSDWLTLRSGSDIRGDAMPPHEGGKVTLTADVAARVGHAFASWLAEKGKTTTDKLRVSVGHDSRLSAQALKAGLIRGLTAARAEVLDCGLCTTPAMFMTTVEPETCCDGAVLITASHHPYYKNGFKLITRAGGLDGEEIARVLTDAAQTTLPAGEGIARSFDFLTLYRARLAQVVRERLEDDAKCPLLGLHVVVDAGNGAGGFYAQFLEELGAYTDGSQFLEPDGRFPAHPPNPENDQAMAALSRAVVENEADLGVIFDADCDRAAIVDEHGKAVNRNRLIALIAAILLEERPGGTIVTDSVTSTGLNHFINEWGGVHYRFKRGYRNVIAEAIRLNEEGIDCPLAIETSGHAALRENYFLDDGMYLVTRLICEAMNRKREGQRLSALIDGLREPVESCELRLSIVGEDVRTASQSVIGTILSHTLENPAWKIAPDNHEGVRIQCDMDGGVDNAWFLLRLSVHDPVMPLNAESDTPGGIAVMLAELYELLKDNGALDLAPLAQYIQGTH